MNQFFKTIWALIKKDFKDVLRNPGVIILVFLPIVFAAIFHYGMQMFRNSSFVLYMVTTMTFAVIPISFLATIVAEEKEKFTLRTLILSGVSSAEFIASKIFVTWVMLQVVNTANFFIVQSPVGSYPKFFIITTIGSVCLLLIGATIGLICKDQMTTGAVASPIMLIFMMPGMMGMVNETLGKIAFFSPIDQIMRLYFGGDMMSLIMGESSPNNNLISILVIAAWTVVAAVVYRVIYKKMQLI